MARQLQHYEHTNTTYQRPNQHWSCGHECEGFCCALGPDAAGRCRAGYTTEGACTPAKSTQGEWICTRNEVLGGPCGHGPRDDGSCCYARVSGECIPIKGEYNKFTRRTTNLDRWFCTRDPDRGGPCEDGPLPDGSCCRQVSACRPTASLRKKRGQVTMVVVALTMATILFFFYREPQELSHPLNPGPITATHSTEKITCADCHSNPSVMPFALAGFRHETAFEDGRLCLKCHEEIGTSGDLAAFSPHTLPPDYLDRLSLKAGATASGDSASVLLALSAVLSRKQESVACSTCHQEHRGKHVNLKYLSNAQCQVCHTSQFRGFTSGHPEFTAWPYRRKTRIFFDHATHFNEYFRNAEVKQFAKHACTDCHLEDSKGGKMLTRRFEQSCIACHESDTRFGQWEILAFPKVDTRHLKDHLSEELHGRLAGWKSTTTREISPLIKMLMSDTEDDIGPQASLELLDAAGRGVKLSRLRKATDEQKEAAAVVAAAVLNRIYTPDGEELKNRLLNSAWLNEAEPAHRERLGENLVDIFLQLRQQVDTGGTLEGSGEPGVEPDPVSSTTDFGGVFSYQPSTGALSYKPGGHADPFLKAVLEVTAARFGKVKYADHLFGNVADHLQGFDSTAAGKCLKCHTLSDNRDETFTINWLAAAPDPWQRQITDFKHRSHTRLPELFRSDAVFSNEACASCHQLGQTGKHIEEHRRFYSGKDHSPHLFQSGFRSLDLQKCASCHTSFKAGDSCLLCHNYHATRSVLEPVLYALRVKYGTGLLADSGSDKPATDPVPGGQEPILPDDDGESLIPDDDKKDDGESLIPGDNRKDDGESLIPDDNKKNDGESLIPESGP